MYHPASRKKLQLIWIINMLQLVIRGNGHPQAGENTSNDLGIKRRNISTDLGIRRSKCLRTCIGIACHTLILDTPETIYLQDFNQDKTSTQSSHSSIWYLIEDAQR